MPLPDCLKGKLKLPLIAAPMFLVSGPDLVVAACQQGIVGSFPTPNARTPAILDEWLDDVANRLADVPDAGPLAANLVVHPSNDRLEDDLALVEKYKVPLVITALGSPRKIVDRVHAYGGAVFADVNSVRFARKAADAGVDGLVLVAAGAGGHTGNMTGFAFVPAVREFFDGTIVLGGGIGDGRAIKAAEVLGADLAYMGTRFIATNESLAHSDYRQMLVDSTIDDLILTNAVTGVHANWLRQSLIAAGMNPNALEKDPDVNFTDPQSGVKRWANTWSAGHGVGVIDRVESVQSLVGQLHREYQSA
ncbi:MAG: nitronate monooxygenase [Rhodobiaceae bacterium]|nr:nitronate monooxygenase [Rhodobiaceae bacterium]